MQAAAPIVQFGHVRKQFAGRPVLDGISFTIRRGEFACLLGPSGCGKSTTLRMIGGLLREFEGSVLVEGTRPEDRWRSLAFVFQSPRLVHWRTALDNVAFGLELREPGMRAEERRRAALQYLVMMGLALDAGKYPAQLSGGERQRVAFARALAVDPALILMDEPFSDLDVNTRERLRDQVITIWQATGKTIVFVTHDVDEAVYLADRIFVFSRKPTQILRILDVGRPRPRDLERDPALAELRREIRALFATQREPPHGFPSAGDGQPPEPAGPPGRGSWSGPAPRLGG